MGLLRHRDPAYVEQKGHGNGMNSERSHHIDAMID